MDMDDKLRELLQNLAEAIINESISESEKIAEALGELKENGYDVVFALELTIGVQKRRAGEEGEGDQEQIETSRSEPGHEIKFKVTKKDLDFFPPGSGIKLDDDENNGGDEKDKKKY